MRKDAILRLASLVVVIAVSACSDEKGVPKDAAEDASGGLRRVCSGCADGPLDRSDLAVRFHHVHLNATSPAAARDFYGAVFDAEPVRLNDAADALWLAPFLLLVNELSKEEAEANGDELVMGLDHFGKGSPDPTAWFEAASANGVEGDTRQGSTGQPTALGDGTPPDGFTFVYVRGPHGERVEVYSNGTIAVAGHEAAAEEFQHVHFLTSNVDETVAWYSAFLELPANPTNGLGRDIVVDRVSLFFAGFPVIDTFVPTDSRPAGHLALSVTDLEVMRRRAGTLGLEVVEEASEAKEGFRSFFVRAPDEVLLEIVEAGAL